MTVTTSNPHPVPLLRMVVLAVVWAAAVELLVLTVGYGQRRGFGSDAHAYWLAARRLSYVLPPRAEDAYLYSPLFADLLRPFGLLPWPVFYGVWVAGSGVALGWLVRPLPARWAVPVVLVCTIELVFGNVHLLLAAAVVAGLSGSRSAWLFPVLTKVATGVGLVWYLARGEWRRLVEIGAVFAVVVGGSVLTQPGAWQAWLGMLLRHDASTPDGMGGFAVRAAVAVVLVVAAARTGSPWAVAVATMLANPVSVLSGVAILAAVPRLAVMGSAPRLSRSTVSPASRPMPSRSTPSPV